VRFSFIGKHRSFWPVAWLFKASDFSRSGFYAWLSLAPGHRARSDAAILANVRAS